MKEDSALGTYDNPVKCRGIDGQYAYLDKLVGPGGIPIEYQRTHSTAGPSGKPLDVYKVTYRGLNQPLIIYLDMYAESRFDKKAPPGLFLLTDFLKTRAWQKIGYLDTVIQREFGEKKVKLPESFAYIHSKAGKMLACGPYIYSKRDFFHLPLADWPTDELINCALQFIHHLKGISASHPIVANSKETAGYFLETFHFKVDEDSIEKAEAESVFSFSANHFIEPRKVTMYFSISNMNS